jgi:hypothetical protein
MRPSIFGAGQLESDYDPHHSPPVDMRPTGIRKLAPEVSQPGGRQCVRCGRAHHNSYFLFFLAHSTTRARIPVPSSPAPPEMVFVECRACNRHTGGNVTPGLCPSETQHPITSSESRLFTATSGTCPWLELWRRSCVQPIKFPDLGRRQLARCNTCGHPSLDK